MIMLTIEDTTGIHYAIPDAAFSLCNLSSLQGALVRKSSGRWAVTPVVEYFHVLPYVGIFSEWISRCDIVFFMLSNFNFSCICIYCVLEIFPR